MKRIKKSTIVICYCIGMILFIAGMTIMCMSCNDNIEVKQVYPFSISHLPVQTKLKQGETAEIRFELHREGFYEETEYFIRYFQTDGYGVLSMADGTVFEPNDLYPLTSEVFRLYYTSQSTDQQKIDIYFVDSHGQIVQVSFSFTNEN